jgi:hypothetical protein
MGILIWPVSGLLVIVGALIGVLVLAHLDRP